MYKFGVLFSHLQLLVCLLPTGCLVKTNLAKNVKFKIKTLICKKPERKEARKEKKKLPVSKKGKSKGKEEGKMRKERKEEREEGWIDGREGEGRDSDRKGGKRKEGKREIKGLTL